MSSKRVRLWDAQRHSSYVKDRDEALEKRADIREGNSVARDIDVIWKALATDERAALGYLLMTGARACIGRCNDDLLARLVSKGLLVWPPGVRPVLTDDLVTTFLIPPALWVALDERRDLLLPPGALHEQAIRDAARQFADQFTPLVTAESPDPFTPAPL